MAIIRKLENHKQEEYIPPKKTRKSEGGHDDSNWLISYADMMTLLCVFYIMLFSMSKIDNSEFEKVKEKVAESMGGKYQSPTAGLGKYINNVLTETGVEKDATMSSDGVSVTIAFHSTLFFDPGSAEISPAGKKILYKVAQGLAEQQKAAAKNYKLVVEGHTDSQPVLGGPFPSNWELSSSRATRVVRLFLEKDFAPENLLAIGYADTDPVAPSRNPDGTWNETNLSKNRRVVLRVLMPDVDSIPWRPKASSEEIKTVGVLSGSAVHEHLAHDENPVSREMIKSTTAAEPEHEVLMPVAHVMPPSIVSPVVSAEVATTKVPLMVAAPAVVAPVVVAPVVVAPVVASVPEIPSIRVPLMVAAPVVPAAPIVVMAPTHEATLSSPGDKIISAPRPAEPKTSEPQSIGVKIKSSSSSGPAPASVRQAK